MKKKLDTISSSGAAAAAHMPTTNYLYNQGLISHKLLQKKSRSLRTLKSPHVVNLDQKQTSLMIMGRIEEEEDIINKENVTATTKRSMSSEDFEDEVGST
jgi:hypothetical protein